MSKSTSDENFFIDPDIKEKVIAHLIKGILAAKGKTVKTVAPETKTDLRLWQNNLGQYLGYLTNNPNVNRPDFFNMLCSIDKKRNPRSNLSSSSVIEYYREFCLSAERLATLMSLSEEDKNKLNELHHFLSKDDIKKILQKTRCSENDLKSAEFFKLFLGSLEEAEKEFIHHSVTNGISDSDAGFFLKKKPLNQKDIVTLDAYGLSETSPSPAIKKSNSSASASTTSQSEEAKNVRSDPELAPNVSPRTESQIAFQNAVKDVFNLTSPANPQARAKLRDRLAEQVLPDWMKKALKDSSEQLDGAEFTTFLLDAIVPDKNKLTDVTEIEWKDGKSNRSEKQTKLELPFKRKNESAATTGIIKCSEMLDAYSEIENLDGENQYEVVLGKKVNAKLSHRPKIDNPDLDIVMSLKRHASRKTDKTRKNSKNEDIFVTEQYRIDKDVALDIIELDAPDNKKQSYEATSFIVHRGGINGGHYVTYVKERNATGSIVWACYDDSSRTEKTGDVLPDESKQAYTIKFSPLVDNYKSKTDASRYKTALPASQGCGTANGGLRCWANAAFAFALSITSLHEKNHKRAPDPAIANPIIASTSTKFNSLTKDQKITEPVVNELIGFDNIEADADGESLSGVIKKLQIIKGLNLEEAGKKIDARLQEVDSPTAKVILENSVIKYLTKLAEEQNDAKINEILGLYEFFSDENNSENTLKIIDAIKSNKTAFIKNPQEFCAQIISPTTTSSSTIPTEDQKKKFQPKAPLFVTSQDLYYAAIDRGDEEKLEELLPYAIEHDKDFLTNALCYTVIGGKDKITNLLLNTYKANPNKKSALYGETAADIAAHLGKTLPAPALRPAPPAPLPANPTPALDITKTKLSQEIKAQNKPTYAYTDRDIDAVNRARNTRDEISYFKNSKGQESGILLKGEKPLTGNGAKTTIELPACDLFQGSSIGSHLKAQLENFKEFSKDKEPSDPYPVKILFPYKTDGWNWKVGEITVRKSGDNLSLKGCAYDSMNEKASLDSGIWDEISKTFRGSFSDKKFTTLSNLKITSIGTPQKGEIASGLYAARAMYNLKTNSNTRNVWNDTSGEESDLRSKDSALVISHNPQSNFCAPLNAGGLVDIFQTENSKKSSSPNKELGSEIDSAETPHQQILNLGGLDQKQLIAGANLLGEFVLKKVKGETASSEDLFNSLDSNPLRKIIFTNDNKDKIKPADQLSNLAREATLIAGTNASPETEEKRSYQDCIDVIRESYADSVRQWAISSPSLATTLAKTNTDSLTEEEEKLKALGDGIISIIDATSSEDKKSLKNIAGSVQLMICAEVELARKSSIEEMKKGVIAMMEKEEKQDSNEKNEATLETVSLIEKFAESNNPILTKDTKNYTPLQAAKEKIEEAKKELSKVNEELSKKSKKLKEASENSADRLGKAKAALKLERINLILETQGEKEEYKKGGKHEYNEQEILKYSAKGILSKALKVSIIEERAKKDEGKNTISKTIDEPKLYKRYARKNFIVDESNKIKFENEKFEGNSFANCTFKNCDFSATDNKTMHFVNCTFDEGCVLPQKLKNQNNNFSGCKFSDKIFDGITEEEKKALKTNLGISVSEVASGGFYEIAKPNPSPTSVAAFKLDSNLITNSLS